MTKKAKNLKQRLGWVGILMIPVALVLYIIANALIGMFDMSGSGVTESGLQTTSLGMQLVSILNIIITFIGILGIICFPIGVILVLVGRSEAKRKNGEIGEEVEKAPVFYSVSAPRVIIYSVLTLGIFEIYWFYKNWLAVAKNDEGVKYPFWRSIFSVFYVYPLFKYIREKLVEKGAGELAGAGFLAWLYIVPAIISNVLYRATSADGSTFLYAILFEGFTLAPVLIVNGWLRKQISTQNNTNFSGLNNLDKRAVVELAYKKQFKVDSMSDEDLGLLSDKQLSELFHEGMRIKNQARSLENKVVNEEDEIAAARLDIVRIGFRKVNNITVSDSDLEQLPDKALERYYQIGVSQVSKK